MAVLLGGVYLVKGEVFDDGCRLESTVHSLHADEPGIGVYSPPLPHRIGVSSPAQMIPESGSR